MVSIDIMQNSGILKKIF